MASAMPDMTHVWVRSGEAMGQIALAHGAGDQEEYAARELAAYAKKMSKASLPIVHGLRNRARPSIIILDSSRPANRKFIAHLPVGDLRDDGFLIQSDGRDLFIVSKARFGIVFGTYQYLRRVLGCRFLDYAPYGEDVPRKTTIEHGPVSILKNPKLAYRGMQMAYSLDRIDWMAKNGFNWVRYGNDKDLDWWDAKLTEVLPHLRKRGIRINFGHHMFHMILPPRLYAEDHPEFYPDGKPRAQFPWSLKSPDIINEVVWRLARFLERHPEIEKLDFWPSDGRGEIGAEEYRALAGEEMPEEGEWAERAAGRTDWGRLGDPRKAKVYAIMAKRVGEALAEKFPGVEIVLAAYADVAQPCPDVRLPGNVTCTIAMYWRCYRHSVSDEGCLYNDQYRQIIREWTALYPDRNVYLSEYYMGMGCHASLPYPVVTAIFRDWPWLMESGIAGAKVNTGRAVSTAVVPYNINYLAFQAIAWGDAASADAFIEDYCKAFFADAWREMRDMYLLWEQSVQDAEHTQPGIWTLHRMFNEDTLARSRELVEAALDKTDNAKAHYRISRVGRLVAYAARALPVSRQMAERERVAGEGGPTEELDKALIPALQNMTEHFESLKDLDQDIVGFVKPTSFFLEGDVKCKPSQWERELGRITQAEWVQNEFDPDILRQTGGK